MRPSDRPHAAITGDLLDALLWHSPLAAVSAAAVAKPAAPPSHHSTTTASYLPRRSATRLHCRADLLCCACRCRYCLLSHCSSAPLSYGSATAAHCRAASYIAATPRRAAPAPAPRRSRRSASLCYMLPALHRAASLLPRCFAAAAPLRYCHSTARPPLGCA